MDNVEKILIVDDEPNVLNSLRRELSLEPSCNLEIHTALDGMHALEIFQSQGPFNLVMSDMRMPSMDGVTFLTEIKKIDPYPARILLTGQADMQSAIDAINEGQVFRFLVKPCPDELLVKAIQDALQYSRLMTLEKRLLQKVLRSSMLKATDILRLLYPQISKQRLRVRAYVKHMASELGLSDVWKHEFAASMSKIGLIALPEDLLDKMEESAYLTFDEIDSIESHVKTGRHLAAELTGPQLGFEIDELNLDTSDSDFDASIEELRNLSFSSQHQQLLVVAENVEKLVSKGLSMSNAVNNIRASDTRYNPVLLDVMKHYAEPC